MKRKRMCVSIRIAHRSSASHTKKDQEILEKEVRALLAKKRKKGKSPAPRAVPCPAPFSRRERKAKQKDPPSCWRWRWRWPAVTSRLAGWLASAAESSPSRKHEAGSFCVEKGPNQINRRGVLRLVP